MPPNQIEEILKDLMLYLDPKILKEGHLPKINKGENYEEKRTQKYCDIIMTIDFFIKKIQKYKIYFRYFYSRSRQISRFDELEHHIHAYLEDLETLRNKLNHYLGVLKNDLKKIATNKAEIDSAFKKHIGKIYKVFEDVSRNRNPHRHAGYKFIDHHVSSGTMAEIFLNNEDAFKNLTEHGKSKVKQQRADALTKGKKYWYDNASKNYKQVLGLTCEVLKVTKEWLYKLLDISSLDFNQ